jgi:hypothetical protein
MVNKLVIKSIIDKYYLGENDSVKWGIKDKNLTIPFMSSSRELIGRITHSNFNLDDCELAIFDTKKLLNLITITHGDLLFTFDKVKSYYTKMHFADENFSLTYALADPLLIGKVGEVTEPNWDSIIPLSKDSIAHLIKAKSALSGETNTNIMTTNVEKDLNGDNAFIFTFGDEHGHNNKVKYQMYGEVSPSNESIPYNSDTFKNILNVNKDMENGCLYFSYKGLMKIEFTLGELTSTYYLVRRESTNF